MSLEFEWDSGKAHSNLSKHGISFEEATTAFGDPLSMTISDPLHSQYEQRFVLLGQSHTGKLVVVVYTEASYSIRIISARNATARERKAYEENG